MNKLGSEISYLLDCPYSGYTYEEIQWLAFYLLSEFSENVWFDLDFSVKQGKRYRQYIRDLCCGGEAKSYGVPRRLVVLFNQFKDSGFRPYKNTTQNVEDLKSKFKRKDKFLSNHIRTLSVFEKALRYMMKYCVLENQYDERIYTNYKPVRK